MTRPKVGCFVQSSDAHCFVSHVDVAVELMFVACLGLIPDETEVGSCRAAIGRALFLRHAGVFVSAVIFAEEGLTIYFPEVSPVCACAELALDHCYAIDRYKIYGATKTCCNPP